MLYDERDPFSPRDWDVCDADDEFARRKEELFRLSIILLVPLASLMGPLPEYVSVGDPKDGVVKDGVEGGVMVKASRVPSSEMPSPNIFRPDEYRCRVGEFEVASI